MRMVNQDTLLTVNVIVNTNDDRCSLASDGSDSRSLYLFRAIHRVQVWAVTWSWQCQLTDFSQWQCFPVGCMFYSI